MPNQWDGAPLEGRPLSDDKRPNKPPTPDEKPAPAAETKPAETKPEDGGDEGQR